MPRKRSVPPPAGIVLTPGAGAGRDHASLVAIDAALSAHGIAVLRLDFPYRIAGRRAPDRPPVLIEAITKAATDFAGQLGVGLDGIALGGRSMGGRMCSMAVAEGLPSAALVLVSYPLHAPGKPDQGRSAHFPQIKVPCLFISGDRDAFGTPSELETATKLIKGPVTHEWLAGGDHGLRKKDDAVVALVERWFGIH